MEMMTDWWPVFLGASLAAYIFWFYIKGITLWVRTGIRLYFRKRWGFKLPSHDISLAICSHKRRGDLIHVLPGRGKGHNERHARLIEEALHAYWLRFGVRFYYTQKVRNLGERRHIHDLTDADHQLAQIIVAPLRTGLTDGKHTPSPDLAHSDFVKLDIVYRTQRGILSLKKALDVKDHFDAVWKCPTIIEPYRLIPGAIRVHPIPQLPTRKWPTARRAGISSDAISFGRNRFALGNIEFDFRKLQRRTHIAVIAGSGGGKTNLVGCLLGWFADKAREERPDKLIDDVFFLDINGAPGLDCYKDMGVTFATTAEEIAAATQKISQKYNERRATLRRNNAPWWAGPVTVVVFDELNVLVNHPSMDGAAEKLVEWASQFRKFGIFLVFFSQRMRANEGIPVGIPSNCYLKIALPLEKLIDATDFFNCQMDAFRSGASPLELKAGEFVLKYPGVREFFYGQADLAEHEQIAEAAE